MKKRIVILALGIILMQTMVACGTGESTQAQDDTNQVVEEQAQDVVVPEAAEEIDEKTAYESFLGLSDAVAMTASIDGGTYMGYGMDASKTGDTITFDELKSLMSKDSNGAEITNNILYSFFKGGGRQELALMFEDDTSDANDVVYIFCYYDNTLHLSDSFYCKGQANAGFHKNGYLYATGISANSDTISSYSYVDAAGKNRDIYMIEILSNEVLSINTDEKIYEKVYRHGKEPAFAVKMYTIDDKNYLVYDLAAGESLNETDQKFILKTSDAGINWVTDDEINSIIADRLKDLKLADDFFDGKEIEWTQL